MDGQEVDFGMLEAALRAALQGRFAGLWVEDSGGPAPDVIHIAVATLTDDDHEPARQVAAQSAPGAPCVLHSVIYTESQLQAFISPFLSLPAEGELPEELTGIEIDVTQNAVVITVSSPPKGKLAELISRIPNAAVRVKTGWYRPLIV